MTGKEKVNEKNDPLCEDDVEALDAVTVIGLVSAYAQILQFHPIIFNIMHPLLNLQPIF